MNRTGLDRYSSSVLKALAALALAAAAPVCSVPVFRYALERWRAAPYAGVLFHQGPLGAEARALLKEIDASNLNIGIEAVDVAGPLTDEHRKLRGDGPLPQLVLGYPDQPEAVAWRGPFVPPNVRGLIDSPR